MTNFGFNTNEVEHVESDFTPVPDGHYLLMIDNYEMKPTASGDQMLKIAYQIVDGDYKDRFIFENYNAWHSTSEKARNIGRSKLKELAEAYSMQFQSTDDLEKIKQGTKPLIAKVKIEKGKPKPDGGQYADSNRIVKMHAYDVKLWQELESGDITQPVQAAPISTANKKPWDK